MRRYSFRRLCRYLFLQLAKLPVPGHYRHWILRLAGIRFPPPSDCHVFIGAGVRLDSLCPEKITIGNHVFIGINTIICKAVSIGDGAVIGAGSVVTRDIPAGEVWAGNPARFIKKLQL